MSNLLIFSVALSVFGPWQEVTPESIHDPVPESVNVSKSYGSVLSRVDRKLKASSQSCPIFESGRLVGYSFSGGCHKNKGQSPLSEFEF